jgi:hypothetical protein
VLAQADSLEAAGEDLLEAIGQPLGWRFGQLWAAAGDHELRCVASWAVAGVESAELERVSRRTPMRRGSGLPGRALERGEAIWLFDAAIDPGTSARRRSRRPGSTARWPSRSGAAGAVSR